MAASVFATDQSFETGSALRNIQVNPGGLSDSPTDEDSVGFKPYVRALAWFLMSEKTVAPLTISIEAPWGSGKSSFMLQLEKAIANVAADQVKRWESIGAGPKPETVSIRFNAWRNDKDEALWAAFAITFLRQLTRRIPFWRKVIGNLLLLWSRLDRGAARWQLFQLTLFALATAALAVIAVIYFKNPGIAESEKVAPVAGASVVALLATAWTAAKKVRDIFGSPLSADLTRLRRNPRYQDKLAFIDRFQDDFSNIIHCYAGTKGRIFVFIDDLDRCDVPRAADLMQAINLLLSTDQANLYFILGIDREMVAAGLAAKHEKILPYLAANRTAANSPPIARGGVEYGYSFLEKFVQVPFRVPVIQNIENLVASLTGPEAVSRNPDQEPDRESESAAFEIVAGSDPEGFDKIVADMAKIFEFNPRRVKQFVSVLRLRVMIALSTNILRLPGRPGSGSQLTLAQLGAFTALLLRWPQLIGDLLANPDALNDLAEQRNVSASRWKDEPGLLEMLTDVGDYSLVDVDLRPLLLVMPDTYGRGLGDSTSSQPSPQAPNPPSESVVSAAGKSSAQGATASRYPADKPMDVGERLPEEERPVSFSRFMAQQDSERQPRRKRRVALKKK